MLIHHKEIYTLDNSQKEDDVITSHPHEQDKNENVAKACQKHGHDEKSCSMTSDMSVATILDVISRFMNLFSENKTTSGHLQMFNACY